MCNFFSAVVKHNGYGDIEVLHMLEKPDGQSHSTIMETFGIHPDSDCVAKVEYNPEKGTFVLDEFREPIWWDEDIQAKTIDKMQQILSDWLRPCWEWCHEGQCLRNNRGEFHCDNGPAATWKDGSQFWYQNDRLHRENGPAVIWADGGQEWWTNGKRHREDGPAWIFPDGSQEYWINEEKQSEETGQNLQGLRS